MDDAVGWAYEGVERVQDTVLAEMLLTWASCLLGSGRCWGWGWAPSEDADEDEDNDDAWVIQ